MGLAGATRSVICHLDLLQIQLAPPCVSPLLVSPLPLVGRGFAKVNARPVCVIGDEYSPIILPPVPYFCAPYLTPGVAKVKLTLNEDNKTKTAGDNGRKVLVKGTPFQVELEVMVPATIPVVGLSDSTPKYPGTAMFITTDGLCTSD